MIIDTSVIMAVLLEEPECDRLIAAMVGADRLGMSAGTLLECAIVVDAHTGPAGRARLDRILHSLGVECVPFSEEQARSAREAYRRYGRSSGHPAGLNFGDCFAYALSVDSGEPLLFKGEDFAATDVSVAAY